MHAYIHGSKQVFCCDNIYEGILSGSNVLHNTLYAQSSAKSKGF